MIFLVNLHVIAFFGFVQVLLDILTIMMGHKMMHRVFLMNTFYMDMYNLIEKLDIYILILARASSYRVCCS